MVSKQGTALGAAIDLGVSSFSSQSEGARVLILVSDGENHEDDPIAAAQRAAEAGVRIYTIGIGTPEGAPIALGDDFLRDESGEMVVTRLDEGVLQQVAAVTDGGYLRATNSNLGLDKITSEIDNIEQKSFEVQRYEEYNEQYSYPLIAGLLLLLLDFLLPPRRTRLFAGIRLF